VSIRKKKVKLASLVGFAYTSTFDVEKNGDIKLVTEKEAEEAFEEGAEGVYLFGGFSGINWRI